MRSVPSPLPSVDRLLREPALESLLGAYGRVRLTAAIRTHLAALRDAGLAAAATDAASVESIAVAVAARLAEDARPSLRPVANLTGTVLHTNLGRALLPQAAIDAIARVALQPCNLEFDVVEGKRGERDSHVETRLCDLTGAEAALVVNNNAAAVLLVLNSLARNRDVIVSRGELVEIGGHFRIPDIMARAGARLREVGTTNRTHLADYADALTPKSAIVMKVHASNYEVRGFASTVSERELAALARERGVPLVTDLGSGTLVDLRQWGLPHEPTVRETIEAGADLVMFSGDKLLGGPQCGIVAGRAALVDKLRRNPLKRALRVDKIVLAALEQVLMLYGDLERLPAELPTLRLLTRTRDEIEPVARDLARGFAAALDVGYEVDVVDCASQIGSGALPVDTLPSVGVRIASSAARPGRDGAVQRLQRALRELPMPVIGRLVDHALILDCRCLLDAAPLIAQLGALRPPGA